MKKRDDSRLFMGILLIAIGLFFLLRQMGLLNFSIWEGFKTFWPLGIVLVGVALLFRMKWLALIFLGITVLLGAVYIAQSLNIDVPEPRQSVQRIPADPAIDTVSLTMNFGAGEVNIEDGSRSFLLRNRIETTDTEDPTLVVEKKGSQAEILIERESVFVPFGKQKSFWDIELSPEVKIDMVLSYGAAEATFDLSRLMVDELEIDNGATDTEIIFGNYPTKCDIDTGASSIKFEFPEDSGVVIEVDGGLVSTDFPDFSKKDDKYYSDNYDEDGENIEIMIDAGASSIKSRFY